MEENKSKVPSVTDLVRQRLQEVAEEICGLFERTIADYEDELSRLKENYQHLNLLDGVFRPKVHIRRSVCSADLQQTLVIKEEVLPEWNPSREQPDDPELLHVKEEQQELPTSGEGDPVDGLVKADITSSPFTAVPVRSEENKEEPQTSQLHPSQTEDNREAESSSSSPAKQMKLETDGEDCGGRSEPPRYNDLKSPLDPNTGEMTSDSSETDEDDDYWQGPISGSKKCFRVMQMVDSQRRFHKKEKRFVCGKTLKHVSTLRTHTQVHTTEKSFGCGVCDKKFHQRSGLKRHMNVHTGEKPYGCSVCGKRLKQLCHLKSHMRVHTGEKPFSCGVCGKRFLQKSSLKRHMRVHTGEKPYGCGVCGKRVNQLCHLKSHMRVHTREKQYGRSVGGKQVNQLCHLNSHM